ncbi:anaerobic ribonucleoside-triphosphate reductase activating protein [bacterium]|nr:anaerobic ribonucleoside-triphosphate reductase activating protein [bacterium]
MNYHNITKEDMLNGEGLRVVLWVAGCNHHCKGCQNPETWDENGGIPFDKEAEDELFEALDKPYISGITFSGGDPLFPGNRDEVFRLIKKFKKVFPQKDIWLYTGYTWEQIKNLEGIEDIDVIAEGEFVEELNDNNLHWVGSSNQRVIRVKESLSGAMVFEP